MNSRLEEQKAELEISELDGTNLRSDIELLNNKLIQLEEENFTSKSVQLDQIKQLEEQEMQIDQATDKISELMRLNYKLEKN